jgi:hypothetical protein
MKFEIAPGASDLVRRKFGKVKVMCNPVHNCTHCGAVMTGAALDLTTQPTHAELYCNQFAQCKYFMRRMRVPVQYVDAEVVLDG